MPQLTTLPMHSEAGLVTLRQVLERLPRNGLLWRVLDFESVGAAPAGMTQDAFRRAISASPDGYCMTWDELLTLADGTEQTWNCLILGCQPGVKIRADTVEEGGFAGCDYVIRAFDSTEWSLIVMGEVLDAQRAIAIAH